MPHSPGTTDADFRRTVMTSIAHGAKALDYFQVTPEQANTENYIAHDDLGRFVTVRDVTYEIGAVDDLIADGRARPPSVALLLSESTDAWDRITPGVADGLQPDNPDDFPSIAYNLARLGVQAAVGERVDGLEVGPQGQGLGRGGVGTWNEESWPEFGPVEHAAGRLLVARDERVFRENPFALAVAGLGKRLREHAAAVEIGDSPHLHLQDQHVAAALEAVRHHRELAEVALVGIDRRDDLAARCLLDRR